MRYATLLLLAAAWVAETAGARAGETITIAAAANLTFVLDPLDAAFRRAHPEVTLNTVLGASGILVTQILQGAPYDVFLSADADYPRKLIDKGGADPASFRVFAFGKLVLWTVRPGLALDPMDALVRNPTVVKLAIANPRTAPYGRAAEEVLTKLGVANEARGKLVTGENISQTAGFVSSGSADAGFVALSLVAAGKFKEVGTWREVPADLYSPIDQGVVLTTRGAGSPGARNYLAFLGSPAARALFERYGYGLPAAPVR